MRLALVGLGSAGLAVARAVHAAGVDAVVAGVDVDPSARTWFQETFAAPAFESLDELSGRVEIDAVWIATPTLDHAAAVFAAARLGVHVIVEKPMTTSLGGAQRMIDACATHGVHLVAGGSRSASATVRAARAAIDAGRIGRLRAMTSLAATDWLLRPRRPDEYDARMGGGVVLRQAPHIVDTFRLLAGGLVRTVRGVTAGWMDGHRATPGYFSAILEFDGDVIATCTYNGHGHFVTSELFDPGTGPGNADIARRVAARRAIAEGRLGDEAKRARLDELRAAPAPSGRSEPFLTDLGIFVVHGELGELRQSANGLYVYGPDGVTDEPVAPNQGPPELDELRLAIECGTPLVHSGEWGLATLEVCLGIVESAQRHADVAMHHQVPVAPPLPRG